MSEQDKTEDAKSDADEVQNDETETETEAAQKADEGEDKLGDAGKQALDRMKERVKAAEKTAREAAAELKKRNDADALRDKPAEEQELEKARAEARAEATTAANKRILRSELKAAAAGKLADPADAHLYINLDDFTVSDDGDTDSDALNEAIEDLITRKPHLAAQKQNRFDGAADQGAKNKDAKPPQWTEDDLARATEEQIVQAKADKKLDNLLGIKTT